MQRMQTVTFDCDTILTAQDVVTSFDNCKKMSHPNKDDDACFMAP